MGARLLADVVRDGGTVQGVQLDGDGLSDGGTAAGGSEHGVRGHLECVAVLHVTLVANAHTGEDAQRSGLGVTCPDDGVVMARALRLQGRLSCPLRDFVDAVGECGRVQAVGSFCGVLELRRQVTGHDVTTEGVRLYAAPRSTRNHAVGLALSQGCLDA